MESQIISSQVPLKLPLLYKSVSVSPTIRLHSFSKGSLTLFIKLVISGFGGITSEKIGIKFEDASITLPLLTFKSILPKYLPCEPDDKRSVPFILISGLHQIHYEKEALLFLHLFS